MLRAGALLAGVALLANFLTVLPCRWLTAVTPGKGGQEHLGLAIALGPKLRCFGRQSLLRLPELLLLLLGLVGRRALRARRRDQRHREEHGHEQRNDHA